MRTLVTDEVSAPAGAYLTLHNVRRFLREINTKGYERSNMQLLPQLENEYTQRELTDVFSGYNHRLRIGDGELYDTMNLSSQYYPLLANRKKRSVARTFTSPGGILGRDRLAFVDKGILYYDGAATAITCLTPGRKQLVSMGAYIVVFPDKVFWSTADPGDYGSLEASYSSVGTVKYRMCRLDGTEYDDPAVSETAPEEPENGDLWIDTSGEKHALMQWNEAASQWTEQASVYTKITFTTQRELTECFSVYDGVTIEGAAIDSLNGEHIIYAMGKEGFDSIIVPGLLDEAVDQTRGSVSIRRSVPDMDYIIECRNRLWGCRFSGDTNELYCCALGDFRNWHRYMGESGDSWAASVGSEGDWTGAVNYMGYPTFFKEDRIYRVSVSAIGAHSVSETVCRGVQKGSDRSLVVANETLFYKSRSDVCAYQGGFPATVSEALGDESYHGAAAGAMGDRYYISMADARGRYHLFVFDMRNALWMHEDDLHVTEFARIGEELYALEGNRLRALMGTVGEKEAFVPWMAETGIMYYRQPDRKYVSRFNLRVQMEKGAEIHIYIQYDSDGVWHRQGSISFRGTNTVTVPVRPRRCDHLRIRLTGKGEFRLFSVARILSYGSDSDGGFALISSRDSTAIPGEGTGESIMSVAHTYTENGVFHVPDGMRYSPVTVAVPETVQTAEALPDEYVCPIVIVGENYYLWRN